MMMDNGRGLIKALENWAKRVTTGYKDVHVRDLSSSFRDGLAFCAIIHHYRPDLIDFESLSKENIFENNSLAFKVAEKQLGVPALLDAEDMVTYAHPDRLSIITYLSQLRNCFENQNKVNTKKLELKRIQKFSSGPPAKVSIKEQPLMPKIRHEVCQICKHRVFILERLIVDGKLYHATCFRCHRCNCLLNPGAYIESDTPGVYECTVCPADETTESTESSMETSEKLYSSDSKTSEQIVPIPKLKPVPEKEFANKEVLEFARSNLIQDTQNFGLKQSEKLSNSLKNSTINLKMEFDVKNSSEPRISVKDKISAFEKSQVCENSSVNISPAIPASSTKFSESSIPSISNKTVSPNHANVFSFSSVISDKSQVAPTNDTNANVAKYSFIKSPVSTTFDGKDSSDTKSNNAIKLSEKKYEDGDDKTSVSMSDLDVGNSPKFSVDSSSKSETAGESPKPPRDIFKTSLQPLKLSFTSSNKKDSPSLTRTSTETERTFHIPQIKSNYATLPHQRIDTKLKRFYSEIKASTSEINLSDEINKQNRNATVRRSSLESNQASVNKKVSDTTVLKPYSKMFNRPHSMHEMNAVLQNDSISSLKNYTPIYNNSLKKTSLLNNNTATSSSFQPLELMKEHPNNRESQIVSTESCNTLFHSENGPKSVSNSETFTPKVEKNENLKSSDIFAKKSSIQVTKEEEYPDDLNPFGDDDDDHAEKDYPDDLNPFGDDDEENTSSQIPACDYDDSKNPFASADEDDQVDTSVSATHSEKATVFENKSSTNHYSTNSNLSSPSDSLKGTFKKRHAPKPPKLSDIFPKDSADSGLDTSFNSSKSSPSVSKKNFQTSSPKIRKNKPAPPPPVTQPPLQDSAADMKMAKESNNMKLKHKSSVQQPENIQPPKQYKKKKRPAPPVPIPIRKDAKKIPLKEIIQEMKEIEEKQREYERQGREIELLIRDRDKDEEPSVEEEEYIMQLFELVNQKNALFRRQAELMYIKRSQRLEEQQHEVEKQIRLLMEKPESDKTDEDRIKEEELTMELIDIVDQRNSIIDSIEMDRRRELEEDSSVQEQIEIKNGDLPIPAEIKQKSKSKKSKSKEKKEKKKREEQESGKGTLKKKNFFKRP